MKIFIRTVKAKPFVVKHIFAGDPLQKDKKNESLGTYQPKREGKDEKLELNIARYDELLIAGAKPTEPADKLRRTISPPPPDLSAPEPEAAPEAEAESSEVATVE
jgi:ribosomal protein S16